MTDRRPVRALLLTGRASAERSFVFVLDTDTVVMSGSITDLGRVWLKGRVLWFVETEALMARAQASGLAKPF